MGRMSARFVGKAVGMSTEWVYDMWKDMGLVIKDKFGDWALTEAGRNIGKNWVTTFSAKNIGTKNKQF